MNSRFSIAVHILTLLASVAEGERITSEMIAGSVGTNPVVIRRQLAMLREANLVESRGARGGGWNLTRPADKITLHEVRAALGDEARLKMHRNDPSPLCEIGQHVRSALALVYADADAAIDRSLDGWTIRQVLDATRNAKR